MRAEAITRALGGRWHGSYGTARCPAHNDRTPSLSIKDGDNGRLLLYCHAGCAYRDIAAALSDRRASDGAASVCRRDPSQAAAPTRPIADLIALLWSQTLPICGTHVESYLRARSITGPMPAALRCHRSLRHPAGQRYPAMVARVEAVDLGVVGLHRTYLKTDAPRQIGDNISKAMLGPCKGGAVRLRDGKKGLAVAEGIETALSLAMGLEHDIAVWAALSAPGMASLRLPPPQSMGAMLIIGTDGDQRGRAAGADLADAASRRGWRAELMSAPDGQDFNDIVAGGANG